MVPLVRRPALWIAGDVGWFPISMTARHIGVLPRARDAGALRSENDGFAVGGHLIRVQFQVLYLAWIVDIDICVINEISSGAVIAKHHMKALATVLGIRDQKLRR